jgi:hypothetical protein
VNEAGLPVVLAGAGVFGAMFFGLWRLWRDELEILHADRTKDVGFGPGVRPDRLDQLRKARWKGMVLVVIASAATVFVWSAAAWSYLLKVRPGTTYSAERFLVLTLGVAQLCFSLYWGFVCLRPRLWRRIARLKRS